MTTTTILSDNGVSSGSAGIKTTGGNDGTLQLQTTSAGGTATTAITVDNSQNVGIGTSSPATNLEVVGNASLKASGSANALYWRDNTGTYIADITGTGGTSFQIESRTAIPIVFGTNGSERARIDSSGNLLVGATSNYGGGRLDVAWDGTGNAAAVRASSASFVGAGFIVYADRNTTNSTFKGIAYYNVGAGAYKFIVQDSGNVQNVNNSYGAISDIKLKENVTDATPKLAQLNQVRVVNYNLIGDSTKQIGVIAQELEQVFPSMIDEEVDRDLDGNELGTTTKSVKYSVFVPMLIKAIQEQQALIIQLQADVAALKGQA